jgi:capsular exopolysaccharide synthesis family protein
VVSINYYDKIKASEILEALKVDYLDYSRRQRQQRLTDGLKFLDRQAPDLQAKTDELLSKLAEFRKRHNQIMPVEEGSLLKEKITSLEDQERKLFAEQLKMQGIRKSIQAGKLSALGFQESAGSTEGAGGKNGVNVTVTNPSLLDQLTKIEQQLAEARAKFKPSSPNVVNLTARKDQLLPLLRSKELEAVDAAIVINSTNLNAISGQKLALVKSFQNQPQLIKQFESLNQKLMIAQENLAGLIKAKENFQLEIAQRSVPWQVIAPPVINPTPVSPNVKKNLFLGSAIGLLAGIGAALIRDRVDHVFHTSQDVQQELKRPMLGYIPYFKVFEGTRDEKKSITDALNRLSPLRQHNSDPENSLSYIDRFNYQESFRNLYTSTRFLSSDKQLRSIAITSSIPSEGKSLIISLLAQTLTELGQRVLLVDADLRKPQIHHRFNLDNLQGLSNLLTDSGHLNWINVIQNVNNNENLFALTAGQHPPDPARLLSSQKMKILVQELAYSEKFDLILYDLPPVLGIADAAIMSEYIDGTLLLVSLDRVDRNLPKQAISRIDDSGNNLLGIIVNATKESSTKGYGYGYGYGYGAYDTRHAYGYYKSDDIKDIASSSSKNGKSKIRDLFTKAFKKI